MTTAVSSEVLHVSWRNPGADAYMLIGTLTFEAGQYTFNYCPEVVATPGFLPIVDFPHLDRRYTSDVLFPFFSTRIPSRSRADRDAWLHLFGLDSAAGPIDVLASSFGRKATDYYEMFKAPMVSGNTAQVDVPLHGLRYQPGALELLDQGKLIGGDALQIAQVSGPALAADTLNIYTADGLRLGHVSAAVLEALTSQGLTYTAASATILRVNSPAVGPRLRVVLRVQFTVRPSVLK